MKIKLTLTTILFLIVCSSYSQDSKFHIGFSAGPSLTWIRNNDSYPWKENPKLAYYLGIDVETDRKSKFNFATGLGFERKGYFFKTVEWHIVGDDPDDYYHIGNYDYLILPVSSIYNLSSKRNIYIKFGLFAGYLIKGTNKMGTKPLSPWEFTPLMKTRLDYGAIFSFGGIIPLNVRNQINIELKYNHGFNNIDEYYDNKKIFNRTSSIVILFSFRRKVI